MKSCVWKLKKLMVGVILLYKFYLKNDGVQVLLPVTPSQMITKKNGNNRTINILNMGEINIIQNGALDEISFSILLPRSAWSFVQKEEGFNEPLYYLNFLATCKESGLPTTIIIFRSLADGSQIFSGNKDMILEDYTVTEKGGDFGDFWVDLHFREYRTAKSTVYQVKNDGDSLVMVESGSNRDSKSTPTTYTVQSGDTLWGIAKTQLNDSSKYMDIATKNSIADPNQLYVGMVLDLS